MSATAVPSLMSLSAAAGMVSALAYWAADVKRRIANDPARDDYLSQTWFDEPRIYPQRILEDLPPGDLRSVYPLIQLSSALIASAPNEAAMLRAFERAAGAYGHGDRSAANARLAEQARYAEGATTALLEAAALAEQGAAELEGDEGTDARPQPSLERRLEEVLPDEVLAALYLAGISVARLRRHKVRPGTRSDMVTALRSSGEAMNEFAIALRGWDATADARRLERPPTGGRFVIYRAADVYGWRLVDLEERVLLDTGAVFSTREMALANIYEVSESAAEAEISDE